MNSRRIYFKGIFTYILLIEAFVTRIKWSGQTIKGSRRRQNPTIKESRQGFKWCAECVQWTSSVADYLFIHLFMIKSIHRYSHEEPSTRNWILGTNLSYNSSSSKNCIIKKHARNDYKYCRLKKSTSIAWTRKVTNYWKETKSFIGWNSIHMKKLQQEASKQVPFMWAEVQRILPSRNALEKVANTAGWRSAQVWEWRRKVKQVCLEYFCNRLNSR